MAGTSKGCSGPCTPETVFNNLVTHFSAGVAAVDATGYKTESARHLTITDASIHADSNGFTVGPAALDSFEWNHVNDQIAGASFSQTATAYDRFGNVKTDYLGSLSVAVSSNLNGSTKGCLGVSDPCTATTAFHSASPQFTAGVASVDATGYKAES